MDAKKLNEELVNIIEKRSALLSISYNDEAYDDAEDELHDLEDDFVEVYGDDLENAVKSVLKGLKSDSDVLHPTAYIPQMAEGVDYGDDPGVPIEIAAYADEEDMDIRLVLIPNPAQFVLMLNGAIAKEMWKA